MSIACIQSEQKSMLKRGLASIPTPKNEFEIVVPEDEASNKQTEGEENMDYVEDQSDLDSQQYERIKAERKSHVFSGCQLDVSWVSAGYCKTH